MHLFCYINIVIIKFLSLCITRCCATTTGRRRRQDYDNDETTTYNAGEFDHRKCPCHPPPRKKILLCLFENFIIHVNMRNKSLYISGIDVKLMLLMFSMIPFSRCTTTLLTLGGPISRSRVLLPFYRKKLHRFTQFGELGYIITLYLSTSYV